MVVTNLVHAGPLTRERSHQMPTCASALILVTALIVAPVLAR